MTPQEQAKKIEEIYNEAIKKLEELGAERKEIIRDYIKELEAQKVDAIRASLGLEKKEEIEKFAEDAGLLGHEDVVELAKQKLQEISKKQKKLSLLNK